MIVSDTVCRACGRRGLDIVLSLGQTPLANSLLDEQYPETPEAEFPLELALCTNCSLAQLTETVSPETMFRDYFYFSSFSETMLQHSSNLVDKVIDQQNLNSDSFVVEIASNDGYLLQYYQKAGIPVLGFEPALNIAQYARDERSIPTVTEFFTDKAACSLKSERGGADVIHAHNVLAHVPDLNGFVNGLKILLNDDGVVVIEVPYVKDLLDKCEFDTIYHEHLCYFSLTALNTLFKQWGLDVVQIERVAIHGGTLRLFIAHTGSEKSDESVSALLMEEQLWGVNQLSVYNNFAGRVELLKKELLVRLNLLKEEGKSIAAYGAAAKGSTLLNYFGIGREYIDFVVDRNIHKQGHYMPGVHIPIKSPISLIDEMPDYVLLLTWNFVDEIIAQQKEYLERGGRFIIPIPEPRIVQL
ncbi:class I SAM-dependent methyltransferase [bacterium]|nr:class I SAM-dependent methyltransferase [bacterium]